MSSRTSDSRHPDITVLIVGGGIGGLMLGLMLERAGIEYQILERSPEHRPLGSAISLNSTVLRLFEQLGLLDDLHKISKFAGRLHLVKEDLETQGHVDLEHFRERYGYNSVVFGRPDLFKMLASHIPPHRLLMSKRILSTSQTELGVLVRCSDGSSYHGDVLVGADGAYSSIRQCMHKTLRQKGMLPRADSEKLKFDQHCVVGITDELDPERFPILKEDHCELYGVIGKKRPYTIWLIPITGNRFAWSIGGRIPDSEVGQEDVRSFSFAEWWPELATDVCDLVRDYTLPDFKTSYRHDDHYKDPSLAHHDAQEGHPVHDDASVSDDDEGSCISGVPSDSSPISSCASSAVADDHGHGGHSHAKRSGSKWKSTHLSPPTDPIRQTDTFSATSSASTSTSSTDPIQSFVGKRKPPPAKPGTVAEIIDATNPERISKVMLESKMFKVWHHERTVLLGDACHKVLPFAGQGAIQAILDGISLANALYDMKTNSIDDITKAFKRYSSERIPVARAAVAGSRSFGKLLNVQGRLSDFIRKISFSRVPPWILRMATDKLHLHRPQLTYLPMVPDRGAAKAHKQEYSLKYLARLAKEKKQAEEASQQKQSAPSTVDTKSAATASGATAATASGATAATASGATAATASGATAATAVSVVASISSSRHETREQHTGEEALDHRHGRERHDHHHHHHARPPQSRSHTLSTLTQDSSASSRKMSSRSLVPPPLPLQAPPRHHPSVYLQQHPEELMMSGPIPSPSRSSSTQSSPTSSSYSLSAGPIVPEEVHRQPRSRRHTVNQGGRSHLSTPRSRSREIPLPHLASLPIPLPYDTYNNQHQHHHHQHQHLPLRSPDAYSTGFGSQVINTPPRSPLRAAPQGHHEYGHGGYDQEHHHDLAGSGTPIANQFRRPHRRTNSDHSLASDILALEQTTALMKERAALREKRSLDQMNAMRQFQIQMQQQQQHQQQHQQQQQQQQHHHHYHHHQRYPEDQHRN